MGGMHRAVPSRGLTYEARGEGDGGDGAGQGRAGDDDDLKKQDEALRVQDIR